MKLWVRKLSCGHERDTSLNFMVEREGQKPQEKDSCFCRECNREVEVTDVYEANKNGYAEAIDWRNYFRSIIKVGKKDD